MTFEEYIRKIVRSEMSEIIDELINLSLLITDTIDPINQRAWDKIKDKVEECRIMVDKENANID